MPFDPAVQPCFDKNRLKALLTLAGPEVAPELGRRLLGDFSAVRQALSQPGSSDDRALLRAQSHILIALGGTIAAEDLTALAGSLNLLAHHGPLAEVSTQLAHLRRCLDDLLIDLSRFLQGETDAS